MNNSVDLIKKIATARRHVKKTKHKKNGWNSYGKYSYFTPEQVEQIVSEACEEAGLLTMFSLRALEGITHGELSIIDIDTGESTIVTMRTEIPSIKATNAAQQLGGCMTYTERYLKMSVFGIVENSLDPDTSDQNEPKAQDFADHVKNAETPEKLYALYSHKRSLLSETERKKLSDMCAARKAEITKKGGGNDTIRV